MSRAVAKVTTKVKAALPAATRPVAKGDRSPTKVTTNRLTTALATRTAGKLKSQTQWPTRSIPKRML